MGRIKNEDLYILDQLVSGNDRLIGSDGDDLKKTKNFSVDGLLGYFQNNNPTDYVLPTATDVILGGVTVDNDSILITVDGELSSPFPVKQNDIIGSIYWDYFRDEANYADQAFGSIDLSISFTPSVLYGSGGQYSFSSGTSAEASGYGSRSHGEEVSSTNTFGVTFGYQNVNNGYASFVAGYSNIENSSTGYGLVFGNNNTSATNSGLMVGVDLISSNGVGTAILGTANLNVNGANNGTSLTQPMIIVGNGTHTTPIGSPWTASVRSNLLVGLRNGEVTLPSTTLSVINGESTGKVLITREWIEAQSFLTSAPNLQAVTDIGATTTNNLEVIGDTVSFDVHNVAYTYGSYASVNPTQAYSGCYTPTGDGYFKSQATQTESTVIFQGIPDRKLSMIATASNVVVEFLTNVGQSITVQPTISAGVFTQTLQAATGTIALKEVGYTVATLPVSPTIGDRAYVTDATAPTYLGTLTGGGAVVCPVFYNGSAWVST